MTLILKMLFDTRSTLSIENSNYLYDETGKYFLENFNQLFLDNFEQTYYDTKIQQPTKFLPLKSKSNEVSRNIKLKNCKKCNTSFLPKSNRNIYCEDCKLYCCKLPESKKCKNCDAIFRSTHSQSIYCENCKIVPMKIQPSKRTCKKCDMPIPFSTNRLCETCKKTNKEEYSKIRSIIRKEKYKNDPEFRARRIKAQSKYNEKRKSRVPTLATLDNVQNIYLQTSKYNDERYDKNISDNSDTETEESSITEIESEYSITNVHYSHNIALIPIKGSLMDFIENNKIVGI